MMPDFMFTHLKHSMQMFTLEKMAISCTTTMEVIVMEISMVTGELLAL